MADYRDHFARCPRCAVELQSAGSTRVCTTCRGQWLTLGALDEMLREMHDGLDVGPPMLVPHADPTFKAVGCPDCSQPMELMKLEGVRVDLCEPHGVWFDRYELQMALTATAEREPRQVGEQIDGLQYHIEPDHRRRR